MSMNFSSLKLPPWAAMMQMRLSLPPEMSLPLDALTAVMAPEWALMHLTAWHASLQI